MAARIFVIFKGKRIGPYTEEEVLNLTTSGFLSKDDLCWHDKLSDWTPIYKTINFLYPTPPPVPTKIVSEVNNTNKTIVSSKQISAKISSPKIQPQIRQSNDFHLRNKPNIDDSSIQKRIVSQTSVSDLQSNTIVYAGFWLRFFAFIIDYLILLVPVYLLGYTIGATLVEMGFRGNNLKPTAYLLSSLITIIIYWLYYACMESSSSQATLGKLALGLRVVTDEHGNRISFGRATGRHFSKSFSMFIIFIGFFMAGFTSRKQALHDMMAGCLVIRK